MKKNLNKNLLSVFTASLSLIPNEAKHLTDIPVKVKPKIEHEHLPLEEVYLKALVPNNEMDSCNSVEEYKEVLNKRQIYLLVSKNSSDKGSEESLCVLSTPPSQSLNKWRLSQKQKQKQYQIFIKKKKLEQEQEPLTFRKKISIRLNQLKESLKKGIFRTYYFARINKARELSRIDKLKKAQYVNPFEGTKKATLSSTSLFKSFKKNRFPVNKEFNDGLLYYLNKKGGYKPLCPVFFNKSTAETFLCSSLKQSYTHQNEQKVISKVKADESWNDALIKWGESRFSKRKEKKISYITDIEYQEQERTSKELKTTKEKLLNKLDNLWAKVEVKFREKLYMSDEPPYNLIAETSSREIDSLPEEDQVSIIVSPKMRAVSLKKDKRLNLEKFTKLEEQVQDGLWKDIKIISLGLGDFVEHYSNLSQKLDLENIEFLFIPDLEKIYKEASKETKPPAHTYFGLQVDGFKKYQKKFYDLAEEKNYDMAEEKN